MSMRIFENFKRLYVDSYMPFCFDRGMKYLF